LESELGLKGSMADNSSSGERKSEFDWDMDEEDDRRNEEDDEDEKLDRQERQDREDDEDVYSDDMTASSSKLLTRIEPGGRHSNVNRSHVLGGI
jgi:hypothetical protein